MAKFRSASGGAVTIFIQGRPDPIYLEEGKTYETDDKATVQALKAHSDVVSASTEKKTRKP